MSAKVEFYNNTYENFEAETAQAVRRETFREDIGQNSWLTADEYRTFIGWLNIQPETHVLEIATGSGGPAVFLVRSTGCHLTGVDINEHGITTARELVREQQLEDRIHLQQADGNQPLPFQDALFDVVICIDSFNHLANRSGVLKEWYRVLKPNGRILFTDPVVITGPVTNQELAMRSSIGFFLFVPPGVNERFIGEAGFKLLRQEDASTNAASVAASWFAAREKYRDNLLQIEGEERYSGVQEFFQSVNQLTAERRLSRVVYVAQK